ncbi:Protein N-acetyltransferase, RimJ/RimL family [Amycolatopsis xylanica]|uniref:Protein N-acetyltransferase, RimJ/RimL family n=1 Tax=Amycolatopsis xylanica TaxID=589385 RepID=A0A1H2VHR3_9PSEU|nr:GNAT family protein [Amycolatopsis xylanica]SDW67945.1 Protein N-acetyltransferase, RimJ/RimL family [Amycolatopsis xylanica]
MPALEFPDPALTDGLVTLRPWRESDLERRFEAFSDPLCLRFSWPLTGTPSLAHVRERFAAQEEARLSGDELPLAIVDAEDHLWGGCSLYDFAPGEARASVGYWVAAGARGRGVATRTTRLLAGWAFEHLALARLELVCEPANVASQRVAERCGFVREGVLRSHIPFQGGRRDSVIFSLLPGELLTSTALEVR